MKKQKPSGAALFMYAVIAVSIVTAAVCFYLWYGDRTENSAVLWAGVTAFTLVYHLWGRIIMGNVTKLFRIDRDHWWFRERSFEKKLYQLLRVRKWKGKALTYRPELFDLHKYSLDEIADTMTKAETDHWVNEGISLVSISFGLIWGETWIFLLTALAAMLFDAQFIVIQRYNRPKVLRVLKMQQKRNKKDG